MIAQIDAVRILPRDPAEDGQVGSGFSEPDRQRSGRWRKFSIENRTLPSLLMFQIPDGHPKLPHLWPVKLLQAGRADYDACGLLAMRAAASLSR